MSLKKFENQEQFEQYKQSSEYKEPNIALVGDNIMYNGVGRSCEFYLNLPTLSSSKVYEIPVSAVCTDYDLNTRTFKFEVDLTSQNVSASDYDVFVIKQFTTEDSNLSGKFEGYSLILDNTEDTSHTEDVLGYTSVEVSADVASVVGSDVLKGAVTTGDLEVKDGLIVKIFGTGFLA